MDGADPSRKVRIRTTAATNIARHHTVEALLSKGFPFSRRLSSHTSCVNALALSSGEGRFLASGGDDLRVRIWDFHQGDLKTPSYNLAGPRGNIFTLVFSTNNRYLYSGGTCETVYRYDTSSMGSTTISPSPERTYIDHTDSIRAISCHPFNEDLFISASEDGTVIRYDARSPSRRSSPQDTLQLASEVTGVQFHPKVDHLFATSESRGNVCLRDERMAFGPMTQRSALGVVRTYNTKLTRKSSSHLSNPEASSLVFDRDGEKLAVTLLHYLPTIYAVSDPNPVAVCSGKKLPSGGPIPAQERTYTNSCTMKHGSFGGPGLDSDEFYGAGSDDFRGYVWKIPPLAQLVEKRTEISATDWWSNNKTSDLVAFTEGFSRPKYIPVELSTPLCRLAGHKSIVNTVVFHPQFLHVLTAGIERDIILHSPTPGSPCTQNLEKTLKDVRSISENCHEDRRTYLRALAGFLPSPQDEEDEESPTISMFDHILREEGQTDVFNVRKWRPESESSEEDVDLDPDSSDDNRDVYEV